MDGLAFKDILAEIDKQPTEIKTAFLATIAKATGLIFCKGKNDSMKKEAEKYLIDQIKNNDNMPPLLKAASISNANKILREYINQNEIVNMAMEYLTDSAEPDKIDADWLSYFFDQVKHVENEDIKIIWAKILAKECECNGKISKRLINILATISVKEAKIFTNLIKFSFYFIEDGDEKTYHVMYDLLSDNNIYYQEGIGTSNLLRLEETGLISISDDGYVFDVSMAKDLDQGIKVVYHERIFTLYPNDPKNILVGNVILTEAGNSLLGLLDPVKVENFDSNLINFFKETGRVVL